VSGMRSFSLATSLDPVRPPAGGPTPTEGQERKPKNKGQQQKKREIPDKGKGRPGQGDKSRLDVEA
jgi:hypothetical protein